MDKDGDGGGSDIETSRAALLEAPLRNVATLGGGSNVRGKWKRKSVVTFALTVLTSSQAILIVWSKRAGKYEYSVTTANFLVETLKCVLSLAALTRIWKTEGVTEDNSYRVFKGNLLITNSHSDLRSVEGKFILLSEQSMSNKHIYKGSSSSYLNNKCQKAT